MAGPAFFWLGGAAAAARISSRTFEPAAVNCQRCQVDLLSQQAISTWQVSWIRSICVCFAGTMTDMGGIASRGATCLLLLILISCAPVEASASCNSVGEIVSVARISGERRSKFTARRISLHDASKFKVLLPTKSTRKYGSVLQMRGGWMGRSNKQQGNEPQQSISEHEKSSSKIVISKSGLTWVAVAAVASLVFLEYAENIAAYASSLKPKWFDMEKFKAKLLEKLTDLNENGGTKGLVLYVVFLSLWGMFGLTTVPVESAAGMAFGWKALAVNAAGKMLASMAAYTLGRLFLEEYVISKLDDNEVFSLVDKSVSKTPYRTSLIVRFGPFPELIKNVGLSVLPPVGFGVFAAATFTQVFPFSTLWTWLGCDSVARMRDDTLPPNRILAGILVAVTAFGIFGAPALVGLWVRDMKLEHDKAA